LYAERSRELSGVSEPPALLSELPDELLPDELLPGELLPDGLLPDELLLEPFEDPLEEPFEEPLEEPLLEPLDEPLEDPFEEPLLDDPLDDPEPEASCCPAEVRAGAARLPATTAANTTSAIQPRARTAAG
jgi:hypothetical protein